MAAPRAGDEIVTHLGVNWSMRVAIALTVVALIGVFPLLGDPPLRLSLLVPAGVALAVVVFLMAGSSAIDLDPDVLRFRTVDRTVLIPWDDVQSIDVRKTRQGPRTHISTADGTWRASRLLTAAGWWPVMGVPAQAEVLRAAWFRADGQVDRPPATRAWGPDPATLDTVIIRPHGLQAWTPDTFWQTMLLIILVQQLRFVGEVDWGWTALGFAAVGLGGFRWSRRHVVLTSSGLEIHRLRTVVIPWSAVQWMGLTVNRQNAIRVRVTTPSGTTTLPAPTRDGLVDDPAFDRKLDFIERCWATHRGSSWAAPAPPSLRFRPPPPAPRA